jgi:ADP-ribose pyrophosphatase YjhB (NUDIX family)
MQDQSRGPSEFVVRVGVAPERDGRVLMVTESKPDVRGMLNLPGGHVELGESLTDAARREVIEETGLDVTLSGLVGIFTAVSPLGRHVLRFVFSATSDDRIAIAPVSPAKRCCARSL